MQAPCPNPSRKPELLAPAGNMEKLRTALRFGADAVYLAGNRFGLRAGADNFTLEELPEAMAHVHGLGRKVYLAVNILAHDADIDSLPAWLEPALQTGPDAVICADPGVMALVRDIRPDMPVHLSTQANTTNRASALFWHRAGVSRIVLARELSLAEIAGIRAASPEGLELEVFIHGAMCMAYSGRCLLSRHLTGRDANRGDCAQPCRWSYAVTEEKRPGEYFPVEQDARGTYLFNARDLCLLRRLPELMAAGVASFKIEGRMKSPFYVATVVKAYREAIDAAWEGRWDGADLARWEREVASVSNRGFTEGFIDGQPGPDAQRTERGGYDRTADFVAVVPEAEDDDAMTGCAGHPEEKGHSVLLEQRNHFRRTDLLECLPPSGPAFPVTVLRMADADGQPIEAAPHPQMAVRAVLSVPVPRGSLLRRPVL